MTAAYPIMIRQRGGQIVNTASAAGLLPTPGAVAYSTTKHAIVGLSRSLRAEAAVYGVGVSVLCPGALEIPILDIAPPDDIAGEPAVWMPDTRKLFRRSTGIKDPDDFAHYALDRIAADVGVIVYGRRTRTFARLGRLSPSVTDRINRLFFTSERKRHVDGH